MNKCEPNIILNLFLFFVLFSIRSALGKLRDLNSKVESMQRLYLWQQQEASYTMLNDFSGRSNNEEEGYEPEM